MVTSGARGRASFGQHQEWPPLASEVALVLVSTKQGHLRRQRLRFFFGQHQERPLLAPEAAFLLVACFGRLFWSAPSKAASGAGGRASFHQQQERPPLAPEAALVLVSTKKGHLCRQRPRFVWSAPRKVTSGARGRASFGQH